MTDTVDDKAAAVPAAHAPKARIGGLEEIDAVRLYMNRVGAEPRSMRSAVVKEQLGTYSRDVAVIKLDKTTGTIEVSRRDGGDASAFVPDELEALAIATACLGVTWPEPMPLQAGPDGMPRLPESWKEVDRDNIFAFYDREGRVVMLQKRATDEELADGSPKYTPHTCYDDGKWRTGEAGGLLPIWGLPQLKECSTVFLHEGASAARKMFRLTTGIGREDKEKLATHPWGHELQDAAHLGWIGGALSPYRTDWTVLAKAGIKTVYIVADNDALGHAAVPKISKHLSEFNISVSAIRFDDSFPDRFDLGDDFPETMFRKSAKGHKAYKGLSFDDCLHPATWATRLGSVPPSKRVGRPPSPPVSLRDVFTRDWWMVASEGKALFVNGQDRSKLYSEDAFNTAVRPFSDTPRTADLFKAKAYSSIVSAIAYEPGSKEGAITVDGDRSINTWTKPRINPKKGDDAKWRKFLEHLFPQEADRNAVMKWVATLIARPEIRMRYGLLLSSTMQGVGKTTLCEVLRVLVGEKNCSSPSVKDVVESAFNSWIVRKRLCFVNEIYEGGKWTAYQKMKSFITDQTLEANEKMVKGYSIRNWAHFILCSNAEVPLSVEQDDRRFLVPEVTGIKKGRQYWEDFYGWLEAGGYSIIAYWAEEYCTKHENVKPSDEAPNTARKTELIEDSRSNYDLLVAGIAGEVKAKGEKGEKIVLVETDINRWLERRIGKKLQPATIRGWLVKAGLFSSKERYRIDGVRTKVASNWALADDESWVNIKLYRREPHDFEAM